MDSHLFFSVLLGESRLEQEVLQTLAPVRQLACTHGSVRNVAAGSELFQEGGMPTCAFVVERGIVRLIQRQAGGQDTLVGLRGPGWLLGTANAMLGHPHTLTAEALVDCRVCVLPSRVLQTQAPVDLRIGHALLQLHCLELVKTTQTAIGQSMTTGRERLEQLMDGLVSKAGARTSAAWLKVHLPVSNRDLAHLLGMAPETLSRTLRSLEDEGKLERGRGWVRLRLPQPPRRYEATA
jgi:CRP-like cAMP-binding protein